VASNDDYLAMRKQKQSEISTLGIRNREQKSATPKAERCSVLDSSIVARS